MLSVKSSMKGMKILQTTCSVLPLVARMHAKETLEVIIMDIISISIKFA